MTIRGDRDGRSLAAADRRRHPPRRDHAVALLLGRPPCSRASREGDLREELAGLWPMCPRVKVPGQVYPFTLLEGMLDEPAGVDARPERRAPLACRTYARTAGRWFARGGGVEQGLRCRYPGRRFGLDGKFQFNARVRGRGGLPVVARPTCPRCRWIGVVGPVPVRRSLSSTGAPFAEAGARDEPSDCGPTARCTEATFDPTRAREYVVNRALGALRGELPSRASIFRTCTPAWRRAGLRRVPHRALPVVEPAAGRGERRRGHVRAAGGGNGRLGSQDRSVVLVALPQHDVQRVPVGHLGERGAPAGDRPHEGVVPALRVGRVEAGSRSGRWPSIVWSARTRRSSSRCNAACAHACTSAAAYSPKRETGVHRSRG